MRNLSYLILALLLSGCASVSLERDFDPSRDFGAYRSWSWMDDKLAYQPNDARLKSDITEARISQAVAEQLEQRGLRQTADGQGDLKVQSVLIVDERQDQITTQYGGGWGGYWGLLGRPGFHRNAPRGLQGRDPADRPVRRQRWQAGLARQR